MDPIGRRWAETFGGTCACTWLMSWSAHLDSQWPLLSVPGMRKSCGHAWVARRSASRIACGFQREDHSPISGCGGLAARAWAPTAPRNQGTQRLPANCITR